MANTTDLMISNLFDEEAIEWINERTGLDFKQFSDGGGAGGPKVLSFEVFGTCPRSLGTDKINELISVFKNAPFINPKYAVLFIDCDDQTTLNGITTV